MCLLASSIVQTFLKIPLRKSRVVAMHRFWVKNSPLALKNVFGKAVNIIFMYLWAPLIVQYFQKI